jgi:hypothetical protein
MRRVFLGAVAIVLCSTSVAAAKFSMQLNAAAQQTARMESGVAAVDDTTPGSSVRFVQTEGDVKKRASVGVIVMNHGEKPFNFGPENVTAKLADGTPVAIITYEQLVKEEKRRQMWAAIAAGLAAAGNSMSAASSGYYSGYGTYSGSTFGTFGSTPYSAMTTGTVSVSGYDYGRAQAAQSMANAQNQATFARMAEQNAANMKSLKSYMRTTTVDPQQILGGSIMFELPKAARDSKSDVPMAFTVTVNGEEHRFDVLLKRR